MLGPWERREGCVSYLNAGVGRADRLRSKRILINIMTTLAKHGWELMASFGASAKGVCT